MTNAGRLENVATMVVTSATILGLYALGAGFWSVFGILFLLNLNYARKQA